MFALSFFIACTVVALIIVWQARPSRLPAKQPQRSIPSAVEGFPEMLVPVLCRYREQYIKEHITIWEFLDKIDDLKEPERRRPSLDIECWGSTY